MPHENTPTDKMRWPRFVILLVIYGALLAAGHWGGSWLVNATGIELQPGTAPKNPIIIAAIALYTVLMAIPFVPGMEISIALFAAFGYSVAVIIYLATVAALSISYLIGRLVPVRLIAYFFRYFGQTRAEALVIRFKSLKPKQRLDVLIEHAPRRYVSLLLKHRYLAIAFALNLPGNIIIGGGGGIALLAGISGLFSFPRYLLVIALAVLPIPLMILLMGKP